MSIGFGGNIIPGGPPPPREGIIIPPGGGIIIPRGGIPGCFISKGLCGCALFTNGGKEDPLPPELICVILWPQTGGFLSLSLFTHLYKTVVLKTKSLLLLFSSRTVLLVWGTQHKRSALTRVLTSPLNDDHLEVMKLQG